MTVPDTERLNGLFAGETMLVLGCGPSLRGASLPWFPRPKIIGCNRVMRTHSVGSLVVVDGDVWQQERKRALPSGCNVITTGNLLSQFSDFPFGRTYVLDRTADAPLDALAGPFRAGQITGYYAAALAARMVNPGGTVVLAGMDLEWRPGEPTHSFCADGRDYGCSPNPLPAGRDAIATLSRARSVRTLVIGPSRLLELGVQRYPAPKSPTYLPA